MNVAEQLRAIRENLDTLGRWIGSLDEDTDGVETAGALVRELKRECRELADSLDGRPTAPETPP